MLSANTGAAAKRKPLSLKLERKNSPKKAALKTVFACDKENQHNANAVVQPINDVKLKSQVFATISPADESEERMALRKRVEEAVATHLAQRSAVPTQEQADIKDNNADLVCLKSHSASADVDSHVPSNVSSKGFNMFTMLAMLLVTSIAIWSGVRVALLKPDAVIALYQPYATVIAGIIPDDLLLRAAQPMHSFQEFVKIDLREEVTEGMEMSVIDAYFYDSSNNDEMVSKEVTTEIGKKEVATEVEPSVINENMLVDAPEESEASEIAEHASRTASTNSIDPSPATEVVLAIAPPGPGRTQMILRKAFDVLTPLKRVLAKVQDKVEFWVRSIRNFFAKGK